MKKYIIIFSFLFFLFCKKGEPEVIAKVINLKPFYVELSLEIKNFDYVDSVIIVRSQEPYSPLKFSYRGLINSFKDTLLNPDFSYKYLIKVKGSSVKETSLNVKTPVPSDYILVPEPIYLETDKSFNLSLKIYNINKVFGISGRILFENSFLKVDSIKKGSLWSQDDLFFSTVKQDTIFFAVTKKRGALPFSGSGKVLNVYFSKNNTGISDIIPFKIVLTDSDGNYLPLPKIKKGKIIIK